MENTNGQETPITSNETLAREIAARCWCDDETEHIEMDVRLAEAFAKRLVPLLEAAPMGFEYKF